MIEKKIKEDKKRIIHIELSEENRVLYWSSSPYESTIEIEIDKDHPLLDSPILYKLVEGAVVKDEEYEQQLIEEEQEKQSKPSDEELNAIALMELTSMIMEGGE